MKQMTPAMVNGFEPYSKKTRRELFLEEIERVVPWSQLCACWNSNSSSLAFLIE